MTASNDKAIVIIKDCKEICAEIVKIAKSEVEAAMTDKRFMLADNSTFRAKYEPVHGYIVAASFAHNAISELDILVERLGELRSVGLSSSTTILTEIHSQMHAVLNTLQEDTMSSVYSRSATICKNRLEENYNPPSEQDFAKYFRDNLGGQYHSTIHSWVTKIDRALKAIELLDA